MTPCEDKLPLLGALIDGELDAANTIAVEQHVKTCPGCAEALAELRSVHDLLARDGIGHTAPEPFRRRLRIVLEAEARSSRSRSSKTRPSWSGAFRPWAAGLGGAALAACLAGVVWLQAGQTSFADELVSDHVRSMMAGHLIDVATSDRHVVKPWFDGKVAFAPTVLDLADKGFPLAGGRLDYVRGQRAAALVYRRRLHVINVFVLPAAAADRFGRDRAVKGYNLVHWSAGGLAYWAVSDLDPHDLAAFRDLYRRALGA